MRRRPALIVAAGCAAALAGCAGDGGEPTADSEGRTLYVARCGACHTLEAAGTRGSSIDLDRDLREVDEARVVAAIRNPPEGMPPNLAEGPEARAIARYVVENRNPR